MLCLVHLNRFAFAIQIHELFKYEKSVKGTDRTYYLYFTIIVISFINLFNNPFLPLLL